jgi:hypothetical protein
MPLRNVIVCEDVREELGGKKSLMGVLGGDIVINALPGAIQLAFYIELEKSPSEGGHISFRISIDETEVAAAEVTIVPDPSKVALIVLPKGLVQFEKECDLIVRVSVNKEPEREMVRKRVTSANPIALAPPS